MTDEHSSGRPRLVSLDSLLLDPNDPRLIDHPRWRPVPEEEIATRRVQAITAERLLAIQSDPVITLMESIARYGWVEAEPIRVRTLARGGLVVADGNRRVLALRRLQEPTNAVMGIAAEQPPRIDEIWLPPAASSRCATKTAGSMTLGWGKQRMRPCRPSTRWWRSSQTTRST